MTIELSMPYIYTTPGHNTCRFMRGVQNHVYEGQTASGCDPHSPGGLVGWTRAFCKPPRKKMALGKANCPQPITIQLPPPAGSKPAQMRIIQHNLAYLRFQDDLTISKHIPGRVWTTRIQKNIWIRKISSWIRFGYEKLSKNMYFSELGYAGVS